MNKLRVDIKQKTECSGCTACSKVCPTQAITMKPDELGFVYPVIDEAKCINCGKCFSICPFSSKYDKNSIDGFPKVFAARMVKPELLLQSQSGGVFSAVANAFIEEGGIVYGASYDEHFLVRHIRVASIKDLDCLKGSKYIQSNLINVFNQVQADLDDGRKVLFSGTSCQILGLKAAIKKENRENLFTIDILCYGVASPKVWNEYLKYLEHKYHNKLNYVNMRDKRDGWKGAKETYKFQNGKSIKRNTFLHLYVANVMNRDCCYSCPFTNLTRVGDISLGDFWNWKNTSHTEFRDNKGISLTIINNRKGEELFRKASDSLYIIESNTKECLQDVLEKSAVRNSNCESFRTCFVKKGFKSVGEKYADLKLSYRIHVALSGLKYKIINSFNK